MADKKEKLSTQDSSGAGEGVDVKLKEKDEKALIEKVFSTWEAADAARVKKIRDLQEGLQLYWGIRAKKDFPFENCANLHVPLVRTITDTLHSNLMGSIDTVKPAAVMPVGPEDVPKARKAEKVLNWQFTTQVDFPQLADRIIQSALLFRYAAVKVRYVIEKKGGKKIYDGLKVDVLPPERVLTPPDASSLDVSEMEYIMQEIPMSVSDLRKRMVSNDYRKIDDEELDKLGGLPSRTARDGSDDFLENIRDLYSGVDSLSQNKSQAKYPTVIEWYGSHDINGDGIDEPIMVSFLKERRKILRVRQWDEDPRPIILIPFSEILFRAEGESTPEMLARINQELNTLHNQRVDAVTITNIPYFFFDPAAGYNPNEVKLTPGLGVPVNGNPSQAIYFPTMQTARPEMYREEDNLFLYAERMLGAGSNVQGILDTKRTTATEVASVDRRAGIRFLTLFNRIKKGMRDVFKLALELDKKYMPPEIQVRIHGIQSEPVFETMRREDLMGEFDITINGNSIIDEQAEKQEMMQVYQLGMVNPLIMRDETALYELTRDLFIKLGVKKVDAYLRKPEDLIPKNPEEEHNLFLQEEDVVPNLNENVEQHLEKHAALITSERFKLLSKRGQFLAVKHYNETLRMKKSIEQMMLVQKLTQVNNWMLQTQATGQIPPEAIGMPPGSSTAPGGGATPGASAAPAAPGGKASAGPARGMNGPR